MAIVDEQQRSELIEKAQEAIKEEKAENSHRICREIVDTISNACNQNQKEIAHELQVLAKTLESINGEKEAFEFKQKTCAIMLEINMEERRKARVHGQEIQVSQNQEQNNNQVEEKNEKVPEAEQRTETIGASQSTSEAQRSPNDPPRSKIIGLPSQTSVPQAPGTSSSSSFFSSKIIGATPSAGTVPPTEPAADTIGGAASQTTDAAALSQEGEAPASQESSLPFKRLAYLYMGTKDYEETVNYYLEILKAEQVWDFDRFGSKVTAFRLSAGPLILISDHRKAPSCQPVFEVQDLTVSVRELKERGWKEQAGPFGTPNGEAYSFSDPGGNSIAIFQVDPDSTDRSYVDPTEY